MRTNYAMAFILLVCLIGNATAMASEGKNSEDKQSSKDKQSESEQQLVKSKLEPAKAVKPMTNSISKQFEILRNDIPEAKTISEQNGVSIPDAKSVYYPCTRLARAANELKLDSIENASAAIKYLEDDDYKLRFIAASALATTFKTHPNGLSMSDVEERTSPRHAKLVETFKAAIAKHFATK
ncbi:hypothetical protein BH11CYA1_BH11CYA1_18410 [soil metagenome]